MSTDRDITFRPVTADDLSLLRGWMEQPHWQEWWGPVEAELAGIRAKIEGRDSTRPFLFLLDGEPCGYIQYWLVSDQLNPEGLAEGPWLTELSADAVGIDMSIGDGANLSQGIGSRVLAAFVDCLRAEGHRHFVIDPHPANARAIAAYTKAGFSPVPELEGRYDGVLIMQYGIETGRTRTSGEPVHAD